jgi:hypothetical protein
MCKSTLITVVSSGAIEHKQSCQFTLRLIQYKGGVGKQLNSAVKQVCACLI